MSSWRLPPRQLISGAEQERVIDTHLASLHNWTLAKAVSSSAQRQEAANRDSIVAVLFVDTSTSTVLAWFTH